MSILVGIISPDSITLATDSHITDRVDGTFNSVDKISIVEFWPNTDVLVAQGGLWSLTNRIVEIMREKAKKLPITRQKSVRDVVEASIRESKQPLDQDQVNYANANPSALIIGYYVKNKPFLDVVYVDGTGIITPATGHYAVAGVGGLASYLLSEYAPEKTHSDIAIATSIFVIKKVKDHTKYCGGNTTVKRLTPLPVYVGGVDYVAKPTTIGQDFVRLAEKRLIKFDEKTKKSRDKPIWDILRRTGSELWVKYRAKVEKEQAERLAKLRKNNP